MGAASTKAAVTVGVNAPLTSGKETETISASWNVCEVKRGKASYQLPAKLRNISCVIVIFLGR